MNQNEFESFAAAFAGLDDVKMLVISDGKEFSNEPIGEPRHDKDKPGRQSKDKLAEERSAAEHN